MSHPFEGELSQQLCYRLTRALPSGSLFLVFCHPGGITDLLISLHWLVKGHNQTAMRREAVSGGGLGTGWGEARGAVTPQPLTLPEDGQHCWAQGGRRRAGEHRWAGAAWSLPAWDQSVPAHCSRGRATPQLVSLQDEPRSFPAWLLLFFGSLSSSSRPPPFVRYTPLTGPFHVCCLCSLLEASNGTPV